MFMIINIKHGSAPETSPTKETLNLLNIIKKISNQQQLCLSAVPPIMRSCSWK